jgi:hypothetical protein
MSTRQGIYSTFAKLKTTSQMYQDTDIDFNSIYGGYRLTNKSGSRNLTNRMTVKVFLAFLTGLLFAITGELY